MSDSISSGSGSGSNVDISLTLQPVLPSVAEVQPRPNTMWLIHVTMREDETPYYTGIASTFPWARRLFIEGWFQGVYLGLNDHYGDYALWREGTDETQDADLLALMDLSRLKDPRMAFEVCFGYTLICTDYDVIFQEMWINDQIEEGTERLHDLVKLWNDNYYENKEAFKSFLRGVGL